MTLGTVGLCLAFFVLGYLTRFFTEPDQDWYSQLHDDNKN